MHITAHAPPPLIKYDNIPQLPSRENFPHLSPLPLRPPPHLPLHFLLLLLLQTLGACPFLGCRKLFLPFYARFRFPSLERGRGSGAYPSRAFLLWFLRTAAKAYPTASSTAWVCSVTTTTMSQKILRKKQKRKSFEELNGTNNRFLISINVLGSAGPIRFVVNEGDLIADVIDTALKSYARQGRLPRLGSDTDQFLLYCANFGADALSPWELIGSSGGRNFVLCKKQIEPEDRMRETRPRMLAQKGCGSWKLWLNKSFKILTI